MENKIYLTVNTDLTNSPQVLSWFEQINQPPIADQQIWWQCQTLMMEGFTNVVEHAHKNLPVATPIDIEVVRFKDCIEIHILCLGKPFNLEQQLQKSPEFEENEQERGRGLKIMSKIADKFSYTQIEKNHYCLSITKHY